MRSEAAPAAGHFPVWTDLWCAGAASRAEAAHGPGHVLHCLRRRLAIDDRPIDRQRHPFFHHHPDRLRDQFAPRALQRLHGALFQAAQTGLEMAAGLPADR